MSAPTAKQPRYIASRLVDTAFGPGACDLSVAVVIGARTLDVDGRLRIREIRGKEHDLTALDAAAVAAALERDDLTRHQDHPLALVNRHYRLLGIAIGPPTPPERLQWLANVVQLGPMGASEMLSEAGQPTWLLFELDDDRDDS